MSEEKKASRKFTVRYATDEDYKRMNFYTIGTLYRAHNSAPTPVANHKPIVESPIVMTKLLTFRQYFA